MVLLSQFVFLNHYANAYIHPPGTPASVHASSRHYPAKVRRNLGSAHTRQSEHPVQRQNRRNGSLSASNLQCASLKTKLEFVAMVDRGAMVPDEWRWLMNLGPIEGGNKPIRRLDTQVVNMMEELLAKMNSENYGELVKLMLALLEGAEK